MCIVCLTAGRLELGLNVYRVFDSLPCGDGSQCVWVSCV